MSKLVRGKNDLKTINPQLADEWHPTKNGTLQPTDVVYGSGKKAWWLKPYDDPITGKHFEWEATVSSRSKGAGCPFLSGQAVWRGYNDLASANPVLAKEWHPTKNGSLLPCTHHASGYLCFFKKKTALTLAASSLMNFSGGGDGDGDISKAIYLSSLILSCLLWLV